MKENTTTLYGSAPDLAGIHRVITKFYGGSTVTLDQSSPTEWAVSTGRGPCDGKRVRLVRGRYRFESFAARP